ncbi:MAG: type II toxin-antitoxin system VapC family toxin [Candidatus Altiarchaeota archaeon]|nr:type II toxin-antitoxin system VapC family toxin [Candidatus Altiarchaeota archaeon]
MKYLIDSYGWFEYFFGSMKGEIIKKIIISEGEVIISPVNLIEVYSKYLRERPKEAEDKKIFMLSRSRMIPLNKGISEVASRFKVDLGMGLAGSIILATAREEKAKVVTGDQHFKGMKDVVFLM